METTPRPSPTPIPLQPWPSRTAGLGGTCNRSAHARVQRTALAAVLGLTLWATPRADAALSGSLALTSDYVWRGTSQTDGKPALQGGVEYGHESGLYLGVWGSNVDFAEDVDDPARIEVDLSAGWRGETASGIGWDLSLVRYIYPRTTEDYDSNELKLALSYAMVTLEVDYSNDAFATGEDAFYYRVELSRELEDLLTLSAAIGYSDLDQAITGEGAPESYVDWRIGAARQLWGVDLDLSYYDTNGNGKELYGDIADGRLVLTLSKAF